MPRLESKPLKRETASPTVRGSFDRCTINSGSTIHGRAPATGERIVQISCSVGSIHSGTSFSRTAFSIKKAFPLHLYLNPWVF